MRARDLIGVHPAGVVLDAGKKVVVYASAGDTSVSVYGLESAA